MANPPYMQPPPPGMGGMPPGGGHGHGPGGPGGPMPGGPMQQNMGGPPRAQVVRRGTSRAVPVVVSAGLAVGVFCGLLFGLGTDGGEATAAPSTGNNVKAKDKDEVPEAFAPTQSPVDKNKPGKPADGSATVAAGSGSDAAGSGSAGSATPAIVKTKVTIEVKPEAAAKLAKITIDDKEIEGNSTELELGDKKRMMKVVVKASGYREAKLEKELDPKVETYAIEIPLTKKSSSSGSSGSRPTVPGAGKKPTGKKTGGGLIDI
ncbi:MAG TPA: hypothetical protein VIU61_02845 [Kofleriaceae bacterium]